MEDTLTPEQTAIEAEALARLEGATADTLEGFNPDGTPKEELLLGKFKSQEDLVNAYKELEKKLGQPKPSETPTADSKPTDTPPVEAEGKLSAKDFTDFSTEFNTNGGLSEETYKSLEAKGLSKEIVDDYIKGKQSLAESKAKQLLEYVGGTEAYNSMVEWARSNYNEQQAKAFDEAIYSGDESRVQEQVDLLSFRMSKGTVNRIEGEARDSFGGLKAFESKAEWQKYTANKLYGKDAKYTNMVDNRYLASLSANTI